MYGYYQRYYCNDESLRQPWQIGIDDRIVNGSVLCWNNCTVFIPIGMVYVHAIIVSASIIIG